MSDNTPLKNVRQLLSANLAKPGDTPLKIDITPTINAEIHTYIMLLRNGTPKGEQIAVENLTRLGMEMTADRERIQQLESTIAFLITNKGDK